MFDQITFSDVNYQLVSLAKIQILIDIRHSQIYMLSQSCALRYILTGPVNFENNSSTGCNLSKLYWFVGQVLFHF